MWNLKESDRGEGGSGRASIANFCFIKFHLYLSPKRSLICSRGLCFLISVNEEIFKT